ncbi:hypothetical protein [Bdellovibrio svalbardensis]|uniref:Uncharacterized protein n=1 Tax=Bdellovibrio svalbardensis TaxID=2972972 RepID=A0ABT6DJ47_9BACT|nr:hypothetical protein [Bdellovibrio svalbardensis]MDG0816855.1 hypothetical protein [Bdellovibrio svalbardensis]
MVIARSVLKSLAKLLGVLLLAVLCFAFITTTAVSYWTVTTLISISSDQDVDHNLKEVTRIGQKYILELRQFEGLLSDINKTKMPPICSTLCNGAFLDQERFSNERAAYLHSFFKNQKAAALQDPSFRIKVEELTFLSKAFPKSLRALITDILESPESKSHPWALTFRFEGVMLSELSGIKAHLMQLKVDSHKLDVFKDLMKSCQGGAPRKKLMEECRKEFPN